MSQHQPRMPPTSEPPPYSPRITDYSYPLPEESVQLRVLQRPPSAHLSNQPPEFLTRDTTGDEESNAYHEQTNAYPPSYMPPQGKDDSDLEVTCGPRRSPRARPGYCCTRRCCVVLFFIIIIAVGVPVGYIMAKKAQFDEHQAAKNKLGT